MNKKRKLALLGLVLVAGIATIVWLLQGKNIAVLNPQGYIAQQQYNLIVFTTALSLLIVIPVFTLTFYIAWKYRASNTKATYTPDWDHSRRLEIVWWVIPLILISILAVITWKTTHSLDPYRPITADKKPLTVQVVALQWKWLFIYPEQNIATVNYLQIPEKTPINFEITADAPMNSFWIPQLGGQVYAMAGMKTKLHLIADKLGTYQGSSANISGEGFAGMKFTAEATAEPDFNNWVSSVKATAAHLDGGAYDMLAEPSKDNPTSYYSKVDTALYDTVMTKYMTPGEGHESQRQMEGAEYHAH